MDRFLVEFSRENPDAAVYELLTVEKSASFSIEYIDDDMAIFSGETGYATDCAFVNTISRILEESYDFQEFTGTGLPDGDFYVRVRDFNGCHNATSEPEIGRKVKGSRNVSFSSPDFKVRAVHKDRWYLAIVVFEKDRKGMESRRAPLRPFFSPIAIHPKYARFLVNTTGTRKGETVLDPFCGTGGILLEAGMLGREIIGNDFSLNMVKGARLNLKYFGLRDAIITNEDIADLELHRQVDAIATDLPYGRNSNMKAESILALYSTAFKKFNKFLKTGGVASVIVSDLGHLEEAEKFFEIVKVVAVPQHRSLTRYFVAMKKKER